MRETLCKTQETLIDLILVCLKRSEMFIEKDEVLSSLLRSIAGSSSSVMERAVWRHFKKAQRLTIS